MEGRIFRSKEVLLCGNALVMTVGGYQFKDFVKIGVPLQFIMLIVMMIAIPILFPF